MRHPFLGNAAEKRTQVATSTHHKQATYLGDNIPNKTPANCSNIVQLPTKLGPPPPILHETTPQRTLSRQAKHKTKHRLLNTLQPPKKVTNSLIHLFFPKQKILLFLTEHSTKLLTGAEGAQPIRQG